MSLDDNRRLYRRWLLELWNGDLAVADGDLVAAQLQGGQADAAGEAGR